MLPLVLMLTLSTADPWHDRFPHDAVAVLEHETRITIEPDGRSITRHRRVTRPLTLTGREDYSDVRIPYVAPFQRFSVLRCVTRLADGRVIEARPHAFNPVTPHGYDAAPDFVGFREMVVSPAAVAEGAEITLEYELVDSALVPWFEAVIPIGEEHPVCARTIQVENHGSRPMRWSLSGRDPSDAGQDGTATWWTFTDIPAYPLAHAGPSAGMSVPRLVVSTCAQWSDLAEWFTSRASACEIPPEAGDSLSVLLTRAVTRQDTLRAIVDVAASSLRLVPAPNRMVWSCRATERIFASGYGEPLEAARLLSGLARQAGHQSVPCLVGDPPGDAPPAVSLLPDPWVMVPGVPPDWLSLRGLRGAPRDTPSAVLPLVPEGLLSAGPDPSPRRGHAVLVLTPCRGDSLSVRGSIRITSALIPDATTGSPPAQWLLPRLTRVIPGASLSVRCVELTAAAVSYVFEGGVAIGKGLTLEPTMQAWFGDTWVPPGAWEFDVVPRIPVLVPSEIALGAEIRIEMAHGIDVVCAKDSVTFAGGGAEVTVVRALGSPLRMLRTLRMVAGWRDHEAISGVRRVLAVEGRPRDSAVFILPSDTDP